MVLVVLLAAVLVLGLLMVGAIWGMNVAASRMVGDKHRDIQFIVETGQVPLQWRVRFDKQLSRLSEDPHNAAKVVKVRQQAFVSCLRRLDRLERYVKQTSLVDNEDTRQILLRKLAQARSEWQAEANLHVS